LKGTKNARERRLLVGVIGYELRTIEGKGAGVFAIRDFNVGETVVVAVIERRDTENSAHATQVGRCEWVMLGDMGSMVNHSCDPNCGVRLSEAGGPDLVARRAIALGEEITFDYAMRNYTVEYFPRSCRCGAKICRGSITGWKGLPDDRKAAYQGFVAPYLLEIPGDPLIPRARG
jgi:uncharacterized protein